MSIQSLFNKQALDLVKDLITDEILNKLTRPALNYIILEFFKNYHKPYDTLNNAEIIEFRKHLVNRINYEMH